MPDLILNKLLARETSGKSIARHDVPKTSIDKERQQIQRKLNKVLMHGTTEKLITAMQNTGLTSKEQDVTLRMQLLQRGKLASYPQYKEQLDSYQQNSYGRG